MERKIFEAAVWAFAQSGQHEKALNTALNLKLKEGKEGLDELLRKLSKYYLRQIDLLNRRKLSADAWATILGYFKAAYDVAKKIDTLKHRSRRKKEVIIKGLKYLQKPNAPVEEFVKFLYETRPGNSNALIKKVIKIYLSIPHLRGEEIVKITQLMMVEKRISEFKKLVPIFIKRGDYQALKLVREKYGKLGDEIVSQSEQIVLSCLNRGKIENAVEAISLIPDNDKKQKYFMLLGVDFVPNGSDVSRGEY